MQRQLAVGALMLAAACAEPTSAPVSSGGSATYSAAPMNQSATPLDLAVIGDVPYGDAARARFSLYGVTPPANVTQVIVDRSIEDDSDWLRLHVDPSTPEVFSWDQVFVP